jgi:hypothetical protein
MATKKKPAGEKEPGTLAPPSLVGVQGMGLSEYSLLSPMGGALSTSVMSTTTLNPSSQILRIRVADAVDSVHTSTTVPVNSAMYMQEVLELVCRRRKLDNPRDYALIAENILVPLDRTVASLQGTVNILLVKRSMLSDLGVDTGVLRNARTTDPDGEGFSCRS